MTAAKRKRKDKRITKEEFYMGIAELASRRSTCARTKVGVVIVNEDLSNILSIGYNGNYRGGPNYSDSEDPGVTNDVHGEINALIKCPLEKGRIMFVTESPCIICAKSIINAGIEILYFRNQYRVKDGLELLKKNIKVVKL